MVDSNKQSRHKSTLAVHAGQRRDGRGVVNAIEPSSAFQYIDSGDKFYPRYFNTPNQQHIIEKIAALENAEAGLVLGSGMAAISCTLLTLLNRGDHVVMLESLYGGTRAFVDTEIPELGIDVTYTDCRVESMVAAIQENTRAIYIETPTNPLMKIVDLAQLARAARERGIVTVVDNTFASPVNQNPIDHGIDIVIHSGTKYLGGHSDLSCGAVVSSAEMTERIRKKAIHYGGNINALTCYLIERSLKTLAIRVERQNENARRVAQFLDQHECVDCVYYPGLSSHEGHELATSQMHDFGGMVAFDLAGDRSSREFLTLLKMITPAMSLGGVETTVTMPIHTSHKLVPPDEQKRLGISERLVRLSIGIESTDDIIGDLEQAFTVFSERKLPVSSTTG